MIGVIRIRTIMVSGVCGAGKSTVAGRLRVLGHRAIDADAAEGLCRWVDSAGRVVDRPAAPSSAWLAAHRWVWTPARLDAIVADVREAEVAVLWMCGGADNAFDFVDRFDRVIMLWIDEQTMLTRLGDPGRGNDFGFSSRTRRYLMENFDNWQQNLRSNADTVIDATGDLDDVVALVLDAALV